MRSVTCRCLVSLSILVLLSPAARAENSALAAADGAGHPGFAQPSGDRPIGPAPVPLAVPTTQPAAWKVDPWQALKDRLAAKGFGFEISYTQVAQVNARGGLTTNDALRNTGVYQVAAALSTEQAGLWRGGTFGTYILGMFGRGVNPLVGSLLDVNGTVFAGHDFYVATLWYEHAIIPDKLTFRVGKLDAAGNFDNNEYANYQYDQFLNASLTNNATIPFPDYGLGAQAVVTPVPWLYGAVGAFDADARGGTTGFETAFHGPAHFLLLNEYGVMPKFTVHGKPYHGTYRLGYWYDPSANEDFIQPEDADTPRLRSGDWGAYASFDQLVWKENADPEDMQGVGLFFRYGYAPGQARTIQNFYSGGVSCTGPVPSRDEDVLAAGFSYASLSEALGHVAPGTEREVVAEFYYKIQLGKYISLTPDLQIVVDPGGDDSLRNAIVAGLRLTATF